MGPYQPDQFPELRSEKLLQELESVMDEPVRIDVLSMDYEPDMERCLVRLDIGGLLQVNSYFSIDAIEGILDQMKTLQRRSAP